MPPKVSARQKRLDKIRAQTERHTVVPTDGIAWANAPHSTLYTRVLTAADPRMPTPAGFKKITLYPPQQTLLHAMYTIEQNPQLRIEEKGAKKTGDGHIQMSPEEAHEHATNFGALLRVSCGLVSEKLGFGKTIMVLALTCASPLPKALPTPLNLCFQTTMPLPVVGQFQPELTVHYQRLLPITVVVAASAVITQWTSATNMFTNLKHITVENVHSLKKFEAAFRANGLKGINLLFIKVGRVTTNFTVAGEVIKAKGNADAKTPAQRSLIGAVGAVTEGYTFARMVVDDFDTIVLKPDDMYLPALFRWVVSASNRGTLVTPNPGGSSTVETFLRENTKYPILATTADGIVQGPMSLHCAPDYVAEYINTTTIEFKHVRISGGQAAAVLRNLGVADDVVEMVNADAIGTAAAALGIDVHNTRDLIQRVLADRCAKYRRACAVLARVQAARETVGLNGYRPDSKELVTLRADLKEGVADPVELFEGFGTGPELSKMFISLEEWAIGERDSAGGHLQRMRDNIREQECQCCHLPLSSGDAKSEIKMDENAYILNCCQIVVCEPCIVTVDGDKRRFITSCPNCAKKISADKDMIRVGKDFDLADALDDRSVAEDTAPASTIRYCLISTVPEQGIWLGKFVTKEVALAMSTNPDNVDIWPCSIVETKTSDIKLTDVKPADTKPVDIKHADDNKFINTTSIDTKSIDVNADNTKNVAADAKTNNKKAIDVKVSDEPLKIAMLPKDELGFGMINRIVYTPIASGATVAVSLASSVNAAGKTDEKTDITSIDNPRLKALIQILRGETPECLGIDVVEDNTPGLLIGKKKIPWPADKPKKYTIYTVFPESTQLVSNTLTKMGIKHVKLQGTRAMKDRALASHAATEGKNACDVMIITAARDSAGICMPYVATGIEYHIIGDPAIRAQLRGRYHRPGREYSSECITILNEAEVTTPAVLPAAVTAPATAADIAPVL